MTTSRLAATAGLIALVLAQPALQAPLVGGDAASPGPLTGLFRELRWRGIGPFRGGRTKAASGVPGRPGLFYIGVVNGGVWKTTDYGRTWQPIFDDQPTGSIGAIAVAPSNPDVIYVGSGEGMQRPDLSTGDGDLQVRTTPAAAGATSACATASRSRRSSSTRATPSGCSSPCWATPTDRTRSAGSSVRLTAASRSARSSIGTRTPARPTWRSTRANPDTVYAVLWESRQGPWENGEFAGPGSGLFKSTDGGDTWRPLTSGLPTHARGARAHRHHRRAERPAPPVRDRRGAGRRGALPLRRRRRELDARQLGPARDRPGRRRRRGPGPPD